MTLSNLDNLSCSTGDSDGGILDGNHSDTSILSLTALHRRGKRPSFWLLTMLHSGYEMVPSILAAAGLRELPAIYSRPRHIADVDDDDGERLSSFVISTALCIGRLGADYDYLRTVLAMICDSQRALRVPRWSWALA